MEIPGKSLQLALPLSTNSQIIIHIHLTFYTTNTMVFLTTTATENSGGLAPMGSFVYAMPNVVLLFLTQFVHLTVTAI